MTMDRLRNLGFLLAFLLTGIMLFSLYGAFKSALEARVDPIFPPGTAFIVGIAMGAAMVALLLIIMITPDRRQTRWVKAITGINTRYLFGLLIVAWMLSMGLLWNLGLPATQEGGLALIGMFAGIFIFMGFIWSVIGE